MTKNMQDKNNGRKKERVQRVLDYHNKKYGTHIAVEGKSIDVYPQLKGQLNWDWVCYDIKTEEEVAVEVKKITIKEAYKREESIDNILDEVRKNLYKKLPGVFVLRVTLDNNYDFPFKKQPANKQAFKDILLDAIVEAAQRLNAGETIELLPKISEELPDDAIAPEAEEPLVTTRERLPFSLPHIIFFNLRKLRNEGSGLGLLGPSIGGSAFPLEKFEEIVSHANEQLELAVKEFNVKETFLVLIEEGYNPKDPPEITEAFTTMNPKNYSEIRQVYFIRGDEVAEISLPTN